MQNVNTRQNSLISCDKEPIHLIGKIQPHGFLLVLNKETLAIEQASANAGEFLQLPANRLLHTPLAALISADEYGALEPLLRAEANSSTQLINLNKQQFFGFMHTSSDKIVLEGEPFTPLAPEEVLASACMLSRRQAAINSHETLESLSSMLAESIQEVLDFDRVVVFQFDQEWNGSVVAEKTKPGMQSFQGHHFPSTDIPAPARALLKAKPVRYIPDVSVTPLPILPYINPTTAAPTNFLQSELRYPSEIHIEYLKNMEVQASLSISVIVKGRLWGLINCSNREPKTLSFWKRQWCHQLTLACANMLHSIQEKRDFQCFSQFKQTEEKLVAQMVSSGDIFGGLFEQPLNLLSLTEASGAALMMENRMVQLGDTPDKKQLLALVDWLSAEGTGAVFQTRSLSAHLPAAAAYKGVASGLLALEISRFNKEYLLYFKPEISEKRVWAGNPAKTSTGTDARLHPRKSFEKWEEVIRGKSLPWTMNDVEIAQLLLKDVVAIRLRNQTAKLKDLSEKFQASAEGLRIKNEQLEGFAYIISHNLRSPLNNIQALYSLYKSSPGNIESDMFLDQINKASNNMLATINDLNTILKTRVGEQMEQEAVDLQALLDKELQNLSAVIIQTGAVITIDLAVRTLYTHKVYMESILHNLLSNALKYISPDRRPEIGVSSWITDGRLFLSVADNGLGIDLNVHGHKIFSLYKTFHRNRNARGIGLYLTKMQVESLGGKISLESTPQKGSTFTVSFDADQVCMEL